MIINVKYHEDRAESARVACDPSSYKAFDKARYWNLDRAGGTSAARGKGVRLSRRSDLNRLEGEGRIGNPQDMRSREEGRF